MGRRPKYEYLVDAGIQEHNAQVLDWMFNHKKGGVSKMMEKDCGLSPKQVSLSVNDLVGQGFLEFGVSHRDTVGRPEKVYWLTKNKKEILGSMIQDIEQKIDELYVLKFGLRGMSK